MNSQQLLLVLVIFHSRMEWLMRLAGEPVAPRSNELRDVVRSDSRRVREKKGEEEE
jgi:hypothetical protein